MEIRMHLTMKLSGLQRLHMRMILYKAFRTNLIRPSVNWADACQVEKNSVSVLPGLC